MSVAAFLAISFNVILGFSLLFHIRLSWYKKNRELWTYLVHEHNMAMIEIYAARGDPFALGKITRDNLENYDALGEFGHGFYNLLNWKIEGLAVDAERYKKVARFHERRIQASN